MIRILKLTMLALLVIIGSASLTAIPGSAADLPAYRFEIVDQTIHVGHGVAISVRLIQTSTGKTVTNATITEQKLLMMMGKMEPMPSPVKMLAPDVNGNYRFACDVVEPGDWELDLSAQIPNEKDLARGALKFKVVK